MNVQDRLLGSDPARLLTVRPRVAVHEPRRKLFKCRYLLLGMGKAVLQQVPLTILTPALAADFEPMDSRFRSRCRDPLGNHLGLSIAGGILNGESHLLQCDVPMLVLTENLSIRFLQRTEQTPLAGCLFVSTRAIVMAIPYGNVFQERVRSLQDRSSSVTA